MTDSRRQDEELFLRPETTTADITTTPKPLRINKAASPPSRTGSAQDGYIPQYNIPKPSGAYPLPSSPPPSGAVPPLPYPDDRARRQATPGAERGGGVKLPRIATPEASSGSPESAGSGRAAQKTGMSGQAEGSSRRARFEPGDPNRPTLAGYASKSPPPQSSKLADRRGTPVTILPESPGGPEPPEKDDDDLFQRPPQRSGAGGSSGTALPQNASPYPDYQQQYYPPPLASATPAPTQPVPGPLHIPNPAGVNRLSSTASTSTTRASRGSPPPPETPIGDQPSSSFPEGGIEARYAASGIPGTGTLNSMQAQSAAAAARNAQYAAPQPRQGGIGVPAQSQTTTPGRSWSPTERTGSEPHGPPVTFQGVNEIGLGGVRPSTTSPQPLSSPQPASRGPTYPRPPQPSTVPSLDSDMSRLNVNEEPPPAYSPPTQSTSQYPNEKGRYNTASPPNTSAGARLAQDPNLRQHPAFANDPQDASGVTPSPQPAQQNGGPHGLAPINVGQPGQTPSPGPSGAGPASPPPLPEGWIAHLDPNSGQYYYIHLPTQSTQWEFPKGPTPLNLQEPMSPVGSFVPLASPAVSTFKNPLASPGFASPGFPVPQQANYHRDSIMSMSSLSSPTAAGFTGPPPSAGVDMYKVAPTNGVYFGPYLRYTNMDLERGLWLGSIMLITDASQPPTIHIHQSVDLSPNPRQLKAHAIFSHQRYLFYRYDIDLRMEDQSTKWTYAITSHLGCTRYEFLVAGRDETSWRFIAHSGNDFALNVKADERLKLGGVGLMWKDVLQKHLECGGFHAQLGLGGQIYADRLWKEVPALRQWTQTSGKENRKNAPWSAKLEEDVQHAYFHYYTSHFDQPHLREAFAQIPHVLTIDDHDIFDGYGSYPEYMQQSHVFKNIGRIGIEMYLLFQHHTTHEILRNVSNDLDLFTITGQGWHFVKYLGPAVVIVGPDTRSERGSHQVMAGPTYQGLFPKVAVLPPSVQHCIWMIPVPIVYPRLEAVEQMAQTVATGKKVATGTFNMVGRIAGGVAGVVGAKGMVNEGFGSIKKAVGKSGLMSGVLSPFGEIDMLDELRDQWTHESKVPPPLTPL